MFPGQTIRPAKLGDGQLRAAAHLHRGFGQLACNLGAACLEAGDDGAVVGQLLRVVVGIAQHESLGKRGGQVALNMAANGQLADRTAEVEFRDFKVFSLAP